MKFKFLGTEIYLSFLFCAALCLMLAIDRTGLILPTLLAVFIHESGHLLAMWAADCQPSSIKLILTSVQITRKFYSKKHSEAAIALCGSAANLVIFGVCLTNYLVFKNEVIYDFAILNFVIAVFNLLPVSGLDGGTLLILLISKFTNIYKAESIVRIITAIFAFVAFLTGVYLTSIGTTNISVFIIAIYLLVCCLAKK